jgi:hypothetical protein
MELITLLEQNSGRIVAEATRSRARSHLEHYEVDGMETTEERLKSLYELTLTCIRKRNASAMTRFAEDVAKKRFKSGFELFEVQTAINVLEESVWKRILIELEPSEFAHAIGLVSTILGIGKDALARAYASLASEIKAPSLDLKALFSGSGAVG